MPMMAPWPADTHTLFVLSSGRGSPMISAWRTSRSVRISSTNHSLSLSLSRPGPPPYLADLTPRRTVRFLTLRIAFIEAWRRPFPHRTRLVRRRNRGQKLDNDRTESARLQRDAVSPQDRISDARRAAAEGARDSGALAKARPIRAVARRGAGEAALYPS